MQIKIKPLSVNQCWQGRRFKSKAYMRYEKLMLLLLPHIVVPKGKLKALFTFGVSSKASDVDNLLKPTIDLLQKKYGFNDKMIYSIVVSKIDVKKGDEFIDFALIPIE